MKTRISKKRGFFECRKSCRRKQTMYSFKKRQVKCKLSNFYWAKRVAKIFIHKYLSHKCTYKNLNHAINHCKFILSTDVEKNPGPNTVIDSSKTICAPYSQGNIVLFGFDAGKQCVAMSLCALVYKHRSYITSSTDLVGKPQAAQYHLHK
jgi:hypothetical protein